MLAIAMAALPAIGGAILKSSLQYLLGPALAVGKWLIEVVVDLSKSREGRLVLLAIVCLCALAYGRWHYIKQGRADMAAHPTAELIAKIKTTLPECKTATHIPPATFDPFHGLFTDR